MMLTRLQRLAATNPTRLTQLLATQQQLPAAASFSTSNAKTYRGTMTLLSQQQSARQFSTATPPPPENEKETVVEAIESTPIAKEEAVVAESTPVVAKEEVEPAESVFDPSASKAETQPDKEQKAKNQEPQKTGKKKEKLPKEAFTQKSSFLNKGGVQSAPRNNYQRDRPDGAPGINYQQDRGAPRDGFLQRGGTGGAPRENFQNDRPGGAPGNNFRNNQSGDNQRQQDQGEQTPEMRAAAEKLQYETDFKATNKMLYDQHNRRVEKEVDYSDLESELDKGHDMNKIKILKQVMTDPDYVARQEFLGASPKPLSVQEQKAQALNKLAAFKQSADILRMIRGRLNKDESMKSYLVEELSKSGTDIGTYMAGDLSGKKNNLKELKSNSEAFLEKKRAEEAAMKQQHLSQPTDSRTFGADSLYGNHAFAPSSIEDRLGKHNKNRISSFKEYGEHLDKISLEAEQASQLKKQFWYDDLFNRYNINELDRVYIFHSDLVKMDQNTIEYHSARAQFDKLAAKIPELTLEKARPSTQDHMEKQLRLEVNKVLERQAEVELARQPYIKKELAKRSVKFQEENAHLSESDRQIEWNKVVEQVTLKNDQSVQLARSIVNYQDDIQADRMMTRGDGSQDMGPADIMANKHYQMINEVDQPLSIDRVTRDGPRDLVGELQEQLKSGPVYDMAKAPVEERPITDVSHQKQGLQAHLEENYDYAKKVESAIDHTRKKVANDILAMQSRLALAKGQKQTLQNIIADSHVKDIESQVLPGQKIYDFISFEEQTSAAAEHQLLNEELEQLLASRKNFKPNSKNASVYENELKALNCHALLNETLGKPNDQLEHYSYVLDRMSANKIKMTVQLDARLFEYAVIANKSQTANDLLQKLSKDRSQSFSPVDPRYLQKFFVESLKTDNIDGVAHLTNYSERYGVNLSNFPINNFRSALNHYLNTSFDLSKVMTFLKFYQRHSTDKARSEFDKIEATQELSQSTLLSLSQKIFGASDGLVALPELFDSLVEQVGTRQVVDPITKEDSLWKLIESQTADKDYIRVAQMSQYSKLGGTSVARYLGNQFGRANSFDHTFRTALRVQGTPMANDFFSEIMQQVNAYTLKNNGQLPSSFTQKRLGDLYLRLKLSEAELAPAMSELLLFTLNKKQMHQQIVDHCSGSNSKSDINKYYLAESLLQGNLKDKSFSEALQSSQVFGEDKDLSACELTQRTKAMFLDRSDQAAIDFFRTELTKREDKALERKNLMVALYDNVMDTKSGKKLSFEQFRRKHEKSKLFSQRLIAQAYAVNSLRKIVQNNDFEGIENALSLYMVLRQERELTGAKFMMMENDRATQIAEAKLSPSQHELLGQLRDRKTQLLYSIHAEDYLRVKELLEVTDGGAQLDAMQGLDLQGLNRVLEMFKDMSFEEARQYSASAVAKQSSKNVQTRGLSRQKQISSIRENLSKATNLQGVIDAVNSQENENDWFEDFANDSKADREASVAQLIKRNSKDFAKQHKLDNKKMNDGKETGNLLRAMKPDKDRYEKITARQTPEERAQYFGGLAQQYKEYFSDPEIGDSDEDEISEERLEDLEDYIEMLMDAIDPEKERELECKWHLHAKKAVLLHHNEQQVQSLSELDPRSPKHKEQLLDYATTMAVMRLEAQDLEDELYQLIDHNKNKKQPKDEEYNVVSDMLYNIDGVNQTHDAAEMMKTYEDGQVLKKGTDAKAILEHFNQRDAQAKINGPKYDLDLDLTSNILPDRDGFKQIEDDANQKAAIIHAQNQKIAKREAEEKQRLAQEEKEEDERSSDLRKKSGFLKQALTSNAAAGEKYASNANEQSWGVELRQVEKAHQKASYSQFYFGRGQEEDVGGYYSHPRQILNDMDNEELSDDSKDARIGKRMGFGVGAGENEEEEENESQSELEERDEDETQLRNEIKEFQHEADVNAYENEIVAKTIRNPVAHFDREDIKETLERLIDYEVRETPNTGDLELRPENRWGIINKYNDRMLHDGLPSQDNYDPLNFYRNSHDKTLLELKEGLTKAVGDQKAHALPIAIQIFNRIQEKAVKATSLTQSSGTGADRQIESINESIEKMDILLSDPSSPIISNMRQSSKYATQKLPETIDQYRSSLKDGDIENNPVDLNVIINDYRNMNKVEDHLQSVGSTLSQVTHLLTEKERQVKEDRVSQKAYDQWISKAQGEKEKADEAYLRNLYTEYLEATADESTHVKRGSDDYTTEISDQTKARLMRDAFRVELGETFVNTSESRKGDSSFPAFYALDLIQFGLKREMPAAIRLGELLLSENCESGEATMPRELARAVKDYMFENQDKYQAAAKYTGPINNTAIYHQARQAGNSQEQPVFMTMDDPYWYQFTQKNYRREDNWRTPSILAWDHKPRGIIGEITGLERMEKSFATYFDNDGQEASSMKM